MKILKKKPSIELAKNLLNWHPTISLEDGLKKCLTYYVKEVQDEK